MLRELEDNLDDWLAEELDNYLDDDYLVFDCPGAHAFVSVPVFYDCIHTVLHLYMEIIAGDY